MTKSSVLSICVYEAICFIWITVCMITNVRYTLFLFTHTGAHIRTRINTHIHMHAHTCSARTRCTDSADGLCRLFSVAGDAPLTCLHAQICTHSIPIRMITFVHCLNYGSTRSSMCAAPHSLFAWLPQHDQVSTSYLIHLLLAKLATCYTCYLLKLLNLFPATLATC